MKFRIGNANDRVVTIDEKESERERGREAAKYI